MTLFELSRTLSALATIAMIVAGSSWIKQYLYSLVS